MKFTKTNMMLLALSAAIAAGIVWSSNNVDAVEDIIG